MPTYLKFGTNIFTNASYITNDEDVVNENDSSFLSQTVIGAYDPNDITESRGESILFEDFTDKDYLYYTIRFQNIGTAEAITVRIEKNIDALLDGGTFQMLYSSHDYKVLREGDYLTWTFNDINLPAQSQDDAGSNGFVYFKIKPAVGYQVGTVIPAQAEIYFDFNAPVITNTFETTFVEENLSVEESKLNTFTLYPNPAQENVTINFNDVIVGDIELEIYDLRGRKILKDQAKDTQSIPLDVSGLNAGIYLLKLKNDSKESVKKLIIK